MSVASPVGAVAEEEFPWHDPALELDERLAMAQDRPFERKLMAAMAQLDCGQCGYLCQTYAEALASGRETSASLCVPGAKPTAKAVKAMLAERPADALAAPAEAAPTPAVHRHAGARAGGGPADRRRFRQGRAPRPHRPLALGAELRARRLHRHPRAERPGAGRPVPAGAGRRRRRAGALPRRHHAHRARGVRLAGGHRPPARPHHAAAGPRRQSGRGRGAAPPGGRRRRRAAGRRPTCSTCWRRSPPPGPACSTW